MKGRRSVQFALLVLVAVGAPGQEASREGLTRALAEGGPLAIEDAITLAIRNNRPLRYSGFDQALAAARTRLGYRRFFPSIELGYSQSDSVAYYSPDSRVRRLSIGLSQLVYDGGRLRFDQKMRRIDLGLQGLAFSGERESLVLEVINLYVGLLRLNLERTILEETFSNARDQQRIAREELDLGEITEIEFLELTLAAKDLEIEIESTAQSQRLRRFELTRLLEAPEDRAAELAETINTEYQGFLADLQPARYIEDAAWNSLELRSKRVELERLAQAVRQAERTWIPSVSANLELSAAGDSFPLTDPGFSLGVDLSFDVPVFPSRTSAQIGKTGPEERSGGFGVTSEPAGDVEGLYSVRLARLQAQRGRAELDDLVKDLEFSIRESLIEIRNLKAGLALLREKRELEQRRRQIQLVQLDVGEITRLDYLEDEVARARLRISIANGIVELFNQEIALLRTTGSSVAGLHVYVLGLEEQQ